MLGTFEFKKKVNGIKVTKDLNCKLSLEKLKEKFSWIFLPSVKTKDAVIFITEFQKLVWRNGTWYNGIWENGIWENGIWENGTWKKGETNIKSKWRATYLCL